jgi:hypothetical protein
MREGAYNKVWFDRVFGFRGLETDAETKHQNTQRPQTETEINKPKNQKIGYRFTVKICPTWHIL